MADTSAILKKPRVVKSDSEPDSDAPLAAQEKLKVKIPARRKVNEKPKSSDDEVEHHYFLPPLDLIMVSSLLASLVGGNRKHSKFIRQPSRMMEIPNKSRTWLILLIFPLATLIR